MHRFRRAFVVALSGAAAFGGGAALAHAAAPSNLYVDNSSASCTDTGSGAGSIATPFCTIQAAANAAVPGDNVGIGPGTYVGAVDIKSRGTAAAPIDFLLGGVGPVVITLGAGQSGPALTVDGASYVDFNSSMTEVNYWPYYRVSDASVSSVLVTGSSHITLEGIDSASTTASSAVEVAGSSSDVTLIHSTLNGQHGGVLLDPGSSGNLISNDVISSQASGIEVDDASNTVIGSNTLWGQSAADDQIDVAAGSTGTSIENNIMAYPGTPAGAGAAISVDKASATGTTEDYNVLWPDQRGTSTALDSAYSWSGNDYPSQAAFTTATGQGKHDLVADPQLQADSPFTDSVTAPQFSSANYAAPDWQTWDFSGNYCAGGDPYVATTGAGNEADCARGAVQQAFSMQQSNESPTSAGPLGVSMITSVYGEINVKGVWTRIPPEPTPAVSQIIAWGDGTSSTVNPHPVNTEAPTSHTYAKPGTYTVTVTITTVDAGTQTGSWPFTTTALIGGNFFDTERGSNATWWSAWQRGPANSSNIAQAAITAMPDGDTQVVAVTSTGSLEHTIDYTVSNTWQPWGVPKNNTTAVSAGIAGMPDGSSQLIEVTSTGTLEHTIRYANGTWQANWGTPAGSTGIAQAAITAMPNGDTQIVAVTTSGVLEFNIRYHTNSWQGWRVLSQPGVKVTDAGIAGMPNGSSQLIEVTSTGTLEHTIRYANGNWQANWGTPAGSTGIAEAAITAMPNGDAQLVAVTTSGVLKHDIRFANNTWQTGGWGIPRQSDQIAGAASPGIAGMLNGSSQIIELSAN